MDFDEYQREARKTAIYPGHGEAVGLSYAALGLVGEAGEIANKVKKILRDQDGEITPANRSDLAKELGDVLWYVAALAEELDAPLSGVAQLNLDKLASRQERGVLTGSGDNR